jgi:transposase
MKEQLNPETLKPIVLAMRQKNRSVRQIARTLGLHRTTVQRLLNPPSTSLEKLPKSQAQSKLDPFSKRIEELSQKEELTIRAIYRTLRQEGYAGGRTILCDRIRELRGSRRMRQAFARYEPAPGLEGQMDWSPYTVKIDSMSTKIHLFSMILSYSRFQYMEIFDDEKQDTLFQGHIEAFEAFEGVPSVILYDNQAPVVTGRLPSGLPMLHPRFEAFARHYGFQPKICLPGNPERKGRVERPFHYFETNFLPLRNFTSIKDMRQQLRSWLDGEDAEPSGNFRVHGTTRRRPVDMWSEEERALLIPEPETVFMPTRTESRLVGKDCLVSVLGNSFTVPPLYVGRQVTVLFSPKTIKVFNAKGEAIAEHQMPSGKGHMVIDPTHYAQIKRTHNYTPLAQLDSFFLVTFPNALPFLEGLKRHLKSIDHIHLKHLQSLLEFFTREQIAEAIVAATAHGVFTVTYVEELLRRRYPAQTGARRFDERMEKPKGLNLGHIDPGSPDTYNDIFNSDNTPRNDF